MFISRSTSAPECVETRDALVAGPVITTLREEGSFVKVCNFSTCDSCLDTSELLSFFLDLPELPDIAINKSKKQEY
jgi:hypothetical protein